MQSATCLGAAAQNAVRSAINNHERLGIHSPLPAQSLELGYPQSVSAAGLTIVHAFQQPLNVDNRELVVNVSVGASIYPDHAQEPEALLKAADVALFRAKSLGRCQLSMFTPDMLQLTEAKFATEQGLRRAIERGECGRPSGRPRTGIMARGRRCAWPLTCRRASSLTRASSIDFKACCGPIDCPLNALRSS